MTTTLRNALAALVGVGAVLITVPLLPSAPSTAPAVRLARDGPGPLPPPTENWLDEGAERRNKQGRKAWLKERHLAPPDVDWLAVERANGANQVARRNALATVPPATSGPRWVERGSTNQAGRMHTATLSPDLATLYGGSALGGVWAGDPDGGGWTPLGDNLYGGAHWLAVVAAPALGDPDVVLAATDWGYVNRSVDRGLTWTTPAGLAGLNEVRRLAAASDGSGTLYLVGSGSGRTRLYRSDDAGASFAELRTLSAAGDLWVPRDGGTSLFVLDGAEVLRSEDRGQSFTSVGAVPGSGGRGELAGSEAGAPTLYVAQGGRLHRSDDAGATWLSGASLTDYWGALNASITDADVVAWGGVECWRSDDGGVGGVRVNRWSDYYGDPADRLHADIMGIDVQLGPDGAELWYVSTDGGLYRSDDLLDTVENLSLTGLRVSQYYSTLTDRTDGQHIAAGSQDQGYQLSNDLPQSGDQYQFDQVLSGDYGHLTSPNGTHDLVWSVYPGFLLLQVGATDPELFYGTFPEGEVYGWLPQVVADPNVPDSVIFPATQLHRITWREREEDFVQELLSDQTFDRRNGEYVTGLAFSPLDPALAWAATSRGDVHRSEDGGATWTRTNEVGPDAHYFYGTVVLPSPTAADTVYLGGSGYGSTAAVYRSTDGGRSWEAWDDGLGDTLVYSLVEAPDGSGVLFAGTETSAWRRDPGASRWEDITGNEAPVTIYWSAEALQTENTIRFGTYGRGIWDYQLDPNGVGCFPVVDRDGDGAACDVDCDDANAAIFPGASEACDGPDLDCDPTDQADADGDGVPVCAADCDDTRADVAPTLSEVCGDGVDQDCDGADAPCRPEASSCGGCDGLSGVTGVGWLLVAGALAHRRRRA